MILFKEDWSKPEHKGAIVDTETTNRSYVRLAGIYKKMGVENHSFLLALHNPLLQGVDPFSEELTTEQKIMIVVECKENPWYYIREIAKAPAISGVDAVQFRGNRSNIALYWLFFNHITTLNIAPRQTGKSISTDVLMCYLLNVGTLNTTVNLLTKDDALRVKNVTRLKDIISELPEYLQLRTRNDSNNTEKITISQLGNTYTTAVAQASIKAALNLGRGMTNVINHIDEIAFIKNIQITLPALLAASGAARSAAKLNNAPYGNIFTTTAGYLASESGEFAYNIYKESFRMTEKLFDCVNEKDLINTIKKNSPNGNIRVLCEYNHRQLGYTDAWLREQIADAMSSGENAAADFLNIWAEGNEVSPIPKKYFKIIQDSEVKDPYITISRYGYITRWYRSEFEVNNKFHNRKMLMSLDTSDAIGNDDIALTIRDITTGEVIGSGVYNETNLITFSEWLSELIISFPNMTVIIERRSSGVMIIDNLIKILLANDIDPFARLFNWCVDDADVNPVYQKEIIDTPMHRRSTQVYTKYRKEFGYATSGSGRVSRDNLYGTAFNACIKYTGEGVHDSTLIHNYQCLLLRMVE